MVGRYAIACTFLVASAAFQSILLISAAEPKKDGGGLTIDIGDINDTLEWSWSKALALATDQDEGDISGWEPMNVDQHAIMTRAPRALDKPSWGGSIRGVSWGEYSKWRYNSVPYITCPYGGSMQVDNYSEEVCFGIGQGICKEGWRFGIDTFDDTTYLMLWRAENPAQPVYKWFPGATHLCIGEKYPNTPYLYVKFQRCVYYLVGPGAGNPNKLARLKIVPDSDKSSRYDTIVKFRDGAGSEDAIWQIFASGAFKTSRDAWWLKKCFTHAPSSSPSVSPSPSAIPSASPTSNPTTLPSPNPSLA